MTTTRLIIRGLAAVLTVALTTPLAVAEPPDQPLDRKIRVMERVIDTVLVDSPNVVVGSRDTTRGLALDGFGALFTFETSLNVQQLHGFVGLGAMPEAQLFLEQAERSRGDRRPDSDRITVKSEEEIAAETERHLKAFKEELVGILVDYGATLAELEDDDWVALAAFLDGETLLFPRPRASASPDRLLVKAKMGDLRAHARGRLDRSGLISRIEVSDR